MGELTNEVPKPMLRVLGRPLLEHHLAFLPDEIDEVIFVIGYLGERIRDYFGDEWQGRRIRYAVQTELNGTAGAIHLVRDMVHGKFLVTMGDDLYVKEDLHQLLAYDAAILVAPIADPRQFGVVETDAAGRLVAIEEKPKQPKSNLVSTNAFALDERFFRYDMVPISEKEFGLPQTLVVMSQRHPVVVQVATGWCPVGKPENLVAAEEFLSHKHTTQPHPGPLLS